MAELHISQFHSCALVSCTEKSYQVSDLGNIPLEQANRPWIKTGISHYWNIHTCSACIFTPEASQSF